MKTVTIRILSFVLACAAFNAHAYSVYTDGGKWGDSTYGTGASVTWSLIETSVSCAGWCYDYSADTPYYGDTTSLSDILPTGYADVIESAFATWAAVADLTFTQVTDDGEDFGTGSDGDIRIGAAYADGYYGVLAYAYFPYTSYSIGGDMILDEDENWTTDGTGIDLFTVVLHELGHSLGLDHSDDVDSVMYAYYGGAVTGLTDDDIAGIQYIYGAAVVPLPMTLWLMLSGLGFISLVARKRTPTAK